MKNRMISKLMQRSGLLTLWLSVGITTLWAQAFPTPPKTGTATISGRVMLDDKPANGVIIVMSKAEIMSSQDNNPIARTVTDSEGRFRLAALPAGRFRIQAAAPGFVSEESAQSPYSMGRPLNLSDNESIENLEFKLTPGGVITGKVTLSNGHPLIATRLRLFQVDANNRKQPVTITPMSALTMETDDRGVYRLYGLQAGRYVVAVGTDSMNGPVVGNGFQQTYHPDVTAENEAKIIEVKPGSEAKDIDIRVNYERRKAYAVTMRVVDAQTGTPLPGVYLGYGSMRGDANQFYPANPSGMSNARGEVRIENVLPGRYGASVSPWRNDGQPVELYSEPVVFEVAESDVDAVEIRAQRGVTISGVALVEGNASPAMMAQLHGLQLYALSRPDTNRAVPSNPQQFTINRDGTFRVNGLVPGKVFFQPLGRQLKGFSLLRIEAGGAAVGDALSVSADQPVTDVRIIFAHGTTVIRGSVKVLNGVLPPGAQTSVRAQRTDTVSKMPSGLFADVDARGQFTLEGVAPGEYELTLGSFWRTPVESVSGNAPPFRNYTAKQKVIVPASGEMQVTMTLDVTPPPPPQPQRSN